MHVELVSFQGLNTEHSYITFEGCFRIPDAGVAGYMFGWSMVQDSHETAHPAEGGYNRAVGEANELTHFTLDWIVRKYHMNSISY